MLRKPVHGLEAPTCQQLRTQADMTHLMAEVLDDPGLHSFGTAVQMVAAATQAGLLKAEPPNPRYEPSAWLRAAVSTAVQRAEDELAEAGQDLPPTATLCAYLGGFNLGEVIGTDEDRTCDRCRKFCPDGLTNGTVVTPTPSGRSLVLDYGLCDECHAREVAA